MTRLNWGMIGGGEGSQIGPVHRISAGLDGHQHHDEHHGVKHQTNFEHTPHVDVAHHPSNTTHARLTTAVLHTR